MIITTRTRALPLQKSAVEKRVFCGGGGKETKPPGNVLEGEKKEKKQATLERRPFRRTDFAAKKFHQTFS